MTHEIITNNNLSAAVHFVSESESKALPKETKKSIGAARTIIVDGSLDRLLQITTEEDIAVLRLSIADRLLRNRINKIRKDSLVSSFSVLGLLINPAKSIEKIGEAKQIVRNVIDREKSTRDSESRRRIGEIEYAVGDLFVRLTVVRDNGQDIVDTEDIFYPEEILKAWGQEWSARINPQDEI